MACRTVEGREVRARVLYSVKSRGCYQVVGEVGGLVGQSPAQVVRWPPAHGNMPTH